MLQFTHIQACPTASASRSVSAARVSGVNARTSFYFGYWFSHWRA